MDLETKLSQLTDKEANDALQALVKNLTILKPEYAALVASEAGMQSVAREAATAVGAALDGIAEPSKDRQPAIVRQLLATAAGDPALRPSLENYLGGKRETLLEPVTTALVLAGIVLVLSTHVKVEAKKKNGKTEWKVNIEKKPTSNPILKKFFALFG